MELTFSGAMTKEDYLSSLKLSIRPISKKGIDHWELWIVLFWFAGAIGLVGIYVLLVSFELFAVWVVLFALSAILGALGLKLRKAPDKYWEENKTLQAPYEGKITNAGIEVRNLHGQSNLQWSNFSGYGEYREVVVLFCGKTHFHPFPRSLFADDNDWEAFREVVGSKLTKSHQVLPFKRSQILVWILIAVSVIVWALFTSGKL